MSKINHLRTIYSDIPSITNVTQTVAVPFTGVNNYSHQGAINNGCHEITNTGQLTETCANQFTSSLDSHMYGGIFTYPQMASTYYDPNPVYQTACNPVYQTTCNPVYQTACNPVYQTTCNPVYQTAWQPETRTQTAEQQTAISGNNVNNITFFNNSNSPFTSAVCKDLLIHVSKKLKEQIWQGEFIKIIQTETQSRFTTTQKPFGTRSFTNRYEVTK